MKPAVIFFLLALPALVFGQFQNIRVSNPSSTDPEEVTIAINPVLPTILAAGANIRYAYWSRDGGNSWKQSQLPVGTWGDPCVIFDANGYAFYGHLANLPDGYFIDRLIVHRSTNGGFSWVDSVEVGFNPPRQQDKEWLAADMTGSPYRNNIYMAWTQFDSYGSRDPADSSRILFSRSTDSGLSWSGPVRVSDRAGDCLDGSNTVEGAVPAIGPNGEVYLSWSGPLGIVFDRSTDGGVTWGTDHVVTSQPGGWDFAVPGIFRCNGMPVTACDAGGSSGRGNIYICWSDQRNGTANTDVFFITSTDGGQSWGPVKKVNDDPGTAQQFFVWMTVDQLTGKIYCVFYDRRNTLGDATDVYMARSADAGGSFQNFRVSQSSFTPAQSIFFGDYTNVAARGGKIYPIWMRMDSGVLSIWTALVTDSTITGTPEEPQRPMQASLSQNYPNPFNPSTVIGYQLASAGIVTLTVYDLLGRQVATLVSERKAAGAYSIRFDGSGLPSGVYFYRLQSGDFTQTRTLLLIR